MATPISGAGKRGTHRVVIAAITMTVPPSANGAQRLAPNSPNTRTSCMSEFSPPGALTPKMTFSCEITMMPPIPAEKPATTDGWTHETYLPSRNTQNAIISTEATMVTFAAPPIPCDLTAFAMNGTVALAVPPIRTGFLPSIAVIGAVKIEVATPRIGGNPIRVAIESP